MFLELVAEAMRFLETREHAVALNPCYKLCRVLARRRAMPRRRRAMPTSKQGYVTQARRSGLSGLAD